MQATIQRFLLWNRRELIVEPFGETAQVVFAKISAYRDMMDGASIHDQGIVNTDPRFIYVPFAGVNLIPTDVRVCLTSVCLHTCSVLATKAQPNCVAVPVLTDNA